MSEPGRARRRGWVAAAVVAITALCAWLVFAPAGGDPPPGAAGAADAGDRGGGAEARPPGARSPQARRFASASLMAGRHALQYEMAMEAPDATGQRARATMALSGELAIAAARPDGWIVGKLEVATLRADAAIAAQLGVEGPATAAALAETFALRVDEDGAISELRHAAAAPLGARNLVSGLLHALQVVQTAEDVGSARWALREPDTDGEVDATYELADERLSKRWGRDRLAGTGAGEDGNGGVTMLAKGGADLHLERAAGALRIAAATHTLDVEADLGMGGVPVRYRGEVRASLRRSGDVRAPWAAAADVAAMERGIGARNLRAPRPPVHVAEGATVQHLALAASAAGRDRGQERRQLRAQLSTLIARDPAHAREAAQLLRRGGPQVDRRTLIEALAGADSDAAKGELAQIMDDAALDRELRADVATGTTFMPRPGDAILASLRANADHAGNGRLGTAALWALAAQAELQLRHNEALAAQLTAEVLARTEAVLGADGAKLAALGDDAVPGPVAGFSGASLDAAAPPPPPAPPAAANAGAPGLGGEPTHRPGKSATFGEAMAFLDALGNLGGQQVFLHIRPWTKHPDHQIRMTAAMALRAVQTSAARTLLIDIMARDPDGWVRRSAVMAAAYHPVDVMVDPVRRALKEDVHANVRLAAAYNLAFWAYESPTLIKHVREAAEREPKPFVARAMRDLEPMLFRDSEGGAVTMEPMLHGGKHIPSIPEAVVPVARQAEKTAVTAEAGLVGKAGGSHGAKAKESAP